MVCNTRRPVHLQRDCRHSHKFLQGSSAPGSLYLQHFAFAAGPCRNVTLATAWKNRTNNVLNGIVDSASTVKARPDAQHQVGPIPNLSYTYANRPYVVMPYESAAGPVVISLRGYTPTFGTSIHACQHEPVSTLPNFFYDESRPIHQSQKASQWPAQEYSDCKS